MPNTNANPVADDGGARQVISGKGSPATQNNQSDFSHVLRDDRAACAIKRDAALVEQELTERISILDIMRSAAFGEGVDDVRAGRWPEFDAYGVDAWFYERGRQWAILAPRNMPLKNRNRRINSAALLLFGRLYAERLIL